MTTSSSLLRLTSKLGEGTTAVVFATNDPNIVVKWFKSDENAANCLRRELKFVDHKIRGVGRILGAGGVVQEKKSGEMVVSRSEPHNALLMERFSTELFRALDARWFPNNKFHVFGRRFLVESIHQILLSAVQLHRSGFAHLDIKPENCMSCGRDTPFKLVDLGFAEPLKPIKVDLKLDLANPYYKVEEVSCTRGSLLYLAPEILYFQGKKEPSYDPRMADAWSIGVTLFALVYGVAPFSGKFSGKRPNFPNIDIGKDIVFVIWQLLASNPNGRASAFDLLELTREMTKREVTDIGELQGFCNVRPISGHAVPKCLLRD